MTRFLNRTATPLITGLFLVALISGVALFFHWNAGAFHAMHEWLSIVLILPFALHLWKNWRPMTAYLRKPVFGLALGASALAALAFVLPTDAASGRGGRPPQFALAEVMLSGTVSEVAAILNQTPDALTERLGAAGFTVHDPEASLHEIAVDSDQPDTALYAVLAVD